MELIQIIYSIIIYGGASVIVVLALTFTVAKTKGSNLNQLKAQKIVIAQPNLAYSQYRYHTDVNSISRTQNSHQSEQTNLRKVSAQPQPQIFQIDQIKQRELKIIRKSTFHTATETTKELQNESKQSSTRYTVVNEQLNKSKAKVMNYYL